MTGGVVELAGPAGAGKTTVATALTRMLPGTRLGPPPGRFATVRALVPATPMLLASRSAAGDGKRWSQPEIRSVGYLLAWQRTLATPEPGRLLLLDHGPVFRLAMLAAHGPAMTRTPTFRQWWRRTARDWAGLLDAVVCLDAPDEVLRSRIDARDRAHRVRHASRSEAEAFLARYREAFAAALELVASAGTPVFHVDTSAPLDEVTHVVRSRIGGITSQALR